MARQRNIAPGGSSPRARGTAAGRADRDPAGRLIPAGAGNGFGAGVPHAGHAAHPRGRGERPLVLRSANCRAGSSPRARGTALLLGEVRDGRRLIPAGAGNGYRSPCRTRCRAAHPRGRGERPSETRNRGTGIGSSPRARGTVVAMSSSSTRSRLIPAGAGNGRPGSRQRRRGPAHPRGRGERPGPREPAQVDHGSSPRARGTAPEAGRGPARRRLIPAGAGNGSGARARTPPATAHPRGRGERARSSRCSPVPDGSSPRARGTVSRASGGSVLPRLIPAGAGNGPSGVEPGLQGAAHPRGRGERSRARRRSPRSTGSSPRARGTARDRRDRDARERLIPAGAGNGSGSSGTTTHRSAHPRGRGERRLYGDIEREADGSSPRARGTGPPGRVRLNRRRLIPAGAGNGVSSRARLPTLAAHPRGRGERYPLRSGPQNSAGSSPRARGTGIARIAGFGRDRLIPAGAGNGSRR